MYKDIFPDDFDTIINRALSRLVDTNALKEQLEYGKEVGRQEGYEKGLKEGSSATMKSFLTSGGQQIFVAGDYIFPFNNNEELYTNDKTRKIISEWMENTVDSKFGEQKQRFERVIDMDKYAEWKINADALDNRFHQLIGSPTKYSVMDQMNRLVKDINILRNQDTNERDEVLLNSMREVLTKLSETNTSEFRGYDNLLKNIEAEKKQLFHNEEDKFVMDRFKRKFVALKTKDTPAVLTDAFSIYNIKNFQSINDSVAANQSLYDRIQQGSLKDIPSSIVDKRTKRAEAETLSSIVNIPVASMISTVKPKARVYDTKSRRETIKPPPLSFSTTKTSSTTFTPMKK